MKITDKKYFSEYYDQVGREIRLYIDSFDFSDQHVNLGYSTQAAAVYSSNIEGNTIDQTSSFWIKIEQIFGHFF